MLSFETYEKLNKKESYSLYTNLYQQKEDQDSLKLLLTQLLSRMDDTNQLLVKNFSFSSEKPTLNGRNQEHPQPQKLVNSTIVPMNNRTDNLVIGSSIIKRISNSSLPEDVQIHSYPGSTSNQKRELVEKYQIQKCLKSLVLQDGTNTILKNREQEIPELFKDFQSLVEECKEKFKPQKLFLCEVPPLRRSGRYNYMNGKIDQWNSLLHDNYKEENSVEIIHLNQQINVINNPETLYHDDIHFNHQLGLPLIKNILMKYITWYSNNLPRENNYHLDHRYNSDYQKYQNFYRYSTRNFQRGYPHQPMNTYHYMGNLS